MSIVHLLRRDIYHRLDHERVFGRLPGWTQAGSLVLADCPVCKGPGALRLEPNRAHGYCTAACGRISWWGAARRVEGMEAPGALAWLAQRAGVMPPEVPHDRFEAYELVDRRADLLEALWELCREQAAEQPAALVKLLGPSGGSDPRIGLFPGARQAASRLKKRGFGPEETAWLARSGMPAGAPVAAYRVFEGEVAAMVWFARDDSGVTEFLAAPAPLATPLIPFWFNEVVGCRNLLLADSVWDCLAVLRAGLVEACGLLPGTSHSAQLAAVLEWRVGMVFLPPDSPRIGERIEAIRASGAAVPYVLAFEKGEGLEAAAAKRPGAELVSKAVHGVRWSCQRRLGLHDMSSEAGRESALGEVFREWKTIESPLEKDQLVLALSDATGISGRVVLEEFRVRQDRQTRTTLEASYRDLFATGESMAVEGRFAELKELLFRKNAEIAGRAFLDQLEPFEAERFFRSIHDLPEGIKTGYPDIDRYIRILPGEVVVVAARPSHGKTTFAVNLLYNFLNLNKVFRREDPYIFFSFELNEEFLTAKLLSRMTGRHSFYDVLEYLRSGLRTDPHLEEALARLRGFGPYLYMVCKPRMTGEDLLAFCQSVFYKHGRIGAVVLDYIQIVGTPATMATREQEIQYILRQLRIVGQEFRTPVVALAQAMRAGPDQQSERPGIQHMMDSRVLEQEANTILVLYNPEIQKAQSSRMELLVEEDIVSLEVIVRKNKYGAINRVVQLEYRMRTNEIKNRGGFEMVYEI
ncbi:MAG: hypothetical protein HYY25_04360 [Candidatus Wallbacteria bacterium]|nr:hypothetical protein [Candidatus Wallbacteria bacterium]